MLLRNGSHRPELVPAYRCDLSFRWGSSPRGLCESVRRALFVTFAIQTWYLDNRLIKECVREVTASQDWEKVVRRIPYIVYRRDKTASA